MRIYLYLRTFPRLGAPLNGGLNKAVHGLATGLAGAGARVTVLCEGLQDLHTQIDSGYDIRCFKTEQSCRSFKLSQGLQQFVKSEMEVGLAVLNGIFMPSVGSLARLLQKRGMPYVIAPHDPYHPEIFRTRAWMKWPYWFLFERPMLRRATAVQVLDERHRDYLRRLDVSTPVICLPNGYLPVEAEREPTLPDGGDPRFIFLGRMDAHNKGLDLLLQAFGELVGANEARLTLQGPCTGDRPALEKQAESLVWGNRVVFLDPDYSKTSSAVISGHHVFCLPSRFEGFGLAALEAMLASRVLLVSEVGGIAPYVRASGCGVVVNSSIKSIREGIRQLLARRAEWPEMGRRGREFVLKNLKWQDIGQKALNEYRQLCGGMITPQSTQTPDLHGDPLPMPQESQATNPGIAVGQ